MSLINYTSPGEVESDIASVAVPEVATLTPTFDAPSKGYQSGTTFFAKKEGYVYTLSRESTATPDGVNVIAANVGRWLLDAVAGIPT